MKITKNLHVLVLVLAMPLYAEEQCESYIPPAVEGECPYARRS